MSSRPSSFVLTQPGATRLYSTEELLNMPSPEWLIEGILPQGAVAALYGAPATFKSFVGLDIALSVARGSEWHGRAVEPGLVLYIAAEGGPGIAKRVRAWLQHYQMKPSQVEMAWMIEAVSVFRGSDDLERLKRRLDQEMESTPILVVVDTLARCFAGDENQQEDMGAFVSGLDHIRHEYGASVMAIRHTNLSGERERGNTALRGGMDTMIVVERPNNGSAVSLKCSKQKDSEEFDEIKLRLHPVSTADSCVLVDPVPSVDERRLVIKATLKESFGLTFDEWFSSVDCARSTFQRYFAELRETGEIVKENGKWRVV